MKESIGINWEGETPCASCKYNTFCEENRTACEAFDRYTTSGLTSGEADQVPSPHVYDAIFKPSSNIRYLGYHATQQIAHDMCQTLGTIYHGAMPFEENGIPSFSEEFIKQHKWVYAVTDCSVPVVVGACGYIDDDPKCSVVSFLYIRQAYQKKGIGQHFLGMVESKSKRVALIPEDESACKFYKKMGYKNLKGTDIWNKQIAKKESN